MEANNAVLQATRARAHPRCIVCSSANPLGLGMECTLLADGAVQGSFKCGHIFEGYNGILHGGVIAALLDSAMTQCLFAHGRQGLTAELKVRYRHGVTIEEPMTVRAWIKHSANRYHVLQAELHQKDCAKAIATAKFMESL